MLSINHTLFLYIHSFAGKHPLLDQFFVIITSLTTQYIVFSCVFLYVLITFFKTNAPLSRLRMLGQALESMFGVLVTWFVIQAIKVLVALPRPFAVLSEVQALSSGATYESFPSAHAGLTFALATVVFWYHKRLGIALYVFAVIVSFSRVYVGVHYPLDILVGALLGYLIPTIFHKGFSRMSLKRFDR